MCLFARVASNLTADESSTAVGVIDAIYTNHLNSRKGRSQQAAAQCKSQSATLRARKSLRTVTRLGENDNTCKTQSSRGSAGTKPLDQGYF